MTRATTTHISQLAQLQGEAARAKRTTTDVVAEKPRSAAAPSDERRVSDTNRSNARKGLRFQDQILATASTCQGLHIVYVGIPMAYAGQCKSDPSVAHWRFTSSAHVDIVATHRDWTAHLEAKVTEHATWDWDKRLLGHQTNLLSQISKDGMFAGVLLRMDGRAGVSRHFLIPWDTPDVEALNGSRADDLRDRGFELERLRDWIAVVERWYNQGETDRD
jgi:hypothetical protein